MPSPEHNGIEVTLALSGFVVDEARLRSAAALVAREEAYPVRFLSIVLAGHRAVRALNNEYLHHDYDTDVLAFSLTDDERVIDGEVYVDLETAQERHDEFGASFADEVVRYLIHGLLHLTGHDDATDAQRDAMRALEDRYLRALADPLGR